MANNQKAITLPELVSEDEDNHLHSEELDSEDEDTSLHFTDFDEEDMEDITFNWKLRQLTEREVLLTDDSGSLQCPVCVESKATNWTFTTLYEHAKAVANGGSTTMSADRHRALVVYLEYDVFGIPLPPICNSWEKKRKDYGNEKGDGGGASSSAAGRSSVVGK